jgi:tetratricopeptide (TPR) repeat protein
MTRRQRLIYLTASAGVLFVAGTGALVWRSRARAEAYRPGEQIEGLTADLARSVPADHPNVTFTDVTRAARIDFRHFSGTRTSMIAEDMGSGAAWADYDNDGWLDLAVANEVGPIDMSDAEQRRSPARTALYHNNHDGTFTDVAPKAGVDFRGWGMGVSWADYDNDGNVDLLLTAYGHNVLYHNDGNGTFSDHSAESGIGTPEGFWSGAAWGDYDKDGRLDLYVTGYVKFTRDLGNAKGKYDVENPASINPLSFKGERNLLFHNDGNGRFTELAQKLGVDNPKGRGLAAAWVDLDEDGWSDLYVGNDESSNALYQNLGNGTFMDVAERARVMDYRSSMGIAVGDWNADGYQDLFLTHWVAQGNALYDNQLAMSRRANPSQQAEPLTFMDEADRFGLGQSSLDFIGWATSFIDYDNDGKLDLFVINGSTLQNREHPTQLVPMQSKVFWNRGVEEGFYDVSPVSGEYFRHAFVGRGAAFADYDNDGDVDLFIVNNGGPGVLLRNDGGNRNHWLQLELRGTKSNRQAIGAKVRVVAGDVKQARQTGAQSPYLSQNSLIETFGLGSLTVADTIEIVWPSGLKHTRTGVAANQRVTIVEGEIGGIDKNRVQAFWDVYRQATAQRVAGQVTTAVETYARALMLDPDHEDALYYYGSMRFTLGDFVEAARAWRHLVTVDPRSGRTHSQLGTLFLCLDAAAPFDLDSAEAHLRAADAINREQTGPHLHLGEVALIRGQLATAREYFDGVLRTNAQSSQALFYSGYIAWKNGDTASARARFAKAASSTETVAQASGASNEGDTKSGGALGQQHARCDDLRSASTVVRGTDASRATMVDSYRRLESLLSRYRARRSRAGG